MPAGGCSMVIVELLKMSDDVIIMLLRVVIDITIIDEMIMMIEYS